MNPHFKKWAVAETDVLRQVVRITSTHHARHVARAHVRPMRDEHVVRVAHLRPIRKIGEWTRRIEFEFGCPPRKPYKGSPQAKRRTARGGNQAKR